MPERAAALPPAGTRARLHHAGTSEGTAGTGEPCTCGTRGVSGIEMGGMVKG